MSLVRTAAKNGIWFAGFKFLTQLVSWAVTIIVARILVPGDYGLMTLASMLTGYIEVFSELGLGAAIVQRKEITQKEYSSNFWFSLMLGAAFSVVAFLLAYPTAWLFDEPRVVPLTQGISFLFLIAALTVVPFNRLVRELRFRAIGTIQLFSVIVSSIAMWWMASAGFGVWTLLGGTIITRTMTVILVFAAADWRPELHFRWAEVRSFLGFGANVAGARSVAFVVGRSDTFVIGKLLGATALGFYGFAMQLAAMPADKIAGVIHQVSFPVFARFQEDTPRLQELFLRTSGYLALLVAPLYLSGIVWGDEIVRGILGDKWIPITFLFRAFCFSQLLVSLISVNGALHTATGRADWLLNFSIANLLVIPTTIYVAARYGLDATAIPWLTAYPVLCAVWMWLTLRKLGLTLMDYAKSVGSHILASTVIVVGVKALFLLLYPDGLPPQGYRLLLIQEIGLAAIAYLAYLWILERQMLIELWSLRRRDQPSAAAVASAPAPVEPHQEWVQ